MYFNTKHPSLFPHLGVYLNLVVECGAALALEPYVDVGRPHAARDHRGHRLRVVQVSSYHALEDMGELFIALY